MINDDKLKEIVQTRSQQVEMNDELKHKTVHYIQQKSQKPKLGYKRRLAFMTSFIVVFLLGVQASKMTNQQPQIRVLTDPPISPIDEVVVPVEKTEFSQFIQILTESVNDYSVNIYIERPNLKIYEIDIVQATYYFITFSNVEESPIKETTTILKLLEKELAATDIYDKAIINDKNFIVYESNDPQIMEYYELLMQRLNEVHSE